MKEYLYYISHFLLTNKFRFIYTFILSYLIYCVIFYFSYDIILVDCMQGNNSENIENIPRLLSDRESSQHSDSEASSTSDSLFTGGRSYEDLYYDCRNELAEARFRISELEMERNNLTRNIARQEPDRLYWVELENNELRRQNLRLRQHIRSLLDQQPSNQSQQEVTGGLSSLERFREQMMRERENR